MTVFTGTTGDDVFVGTTSADTFTLDQGGDDTAQGGRGADLFLLGGSLTADDRLDAGGSDLDTLLLAGDYSAGLVVDADTLTNFEYLILGEGHSYDLSGFTRDSVGRSFSVDARALGKGDTARVDTSGVNVEVTMHGGHGDDVLTASDQDDILTGEQGKDSLIGGDGDDYLDGGNGADKLVGGLGGDHLTGGAGPDRFFYLETADSTLADADLITDFAAGDLIWLKPIDADGKKAGDQAFEIVDSFTHHRGELMLVHDEGTTTVMGDVDGDGGADLVIHVSANLDAASFAL